MTTEERICRRLAPSVRSIPNSRMRWAIVIEKVLKIRKPPTTTATPGEHEQGDRQELQVVLDVRRTPARRSPRRCARRPSRAAPAGRGCARSLGLDALGGLDRDLVELAAACSATRWASGRVRVDDRRAAEVGLAELGDARRSCSARAPRSPTTPTLSPISRLPRSAVVGSIAASSSVSGRPALLVGERRRRARWTWTPMKFGRELAADRVAVLVHDPARARRSSPRPSPRPRRP